MSTRQKYLLFFSLAVLVLGALWVTAAPEDVRTQHNSEFATVSGAPAVNSAPSAKLENDPIAESKTIVAQKALKEDLVLLKALYESRSGRAFVNYAMQHPELGGVFYSRALLRSCWLVRADDDQLLRLQSGTDRESDGHTYRERSTATQFLRQRCSDFTEGELNGADLAGVSDRDTLTASSAQLAVAVRDKNIAEARLAVKQILQSADPVQLDQLGVRIFASALQHDLKAYFDGVRYPIASEVLQTAVYLLPCNVGMSCIIENDMALALQCAIGQACYATREARAEAEMVSGNRDTFVQAKELAERMSREIRLGNIDAFFPK